MSVITPKIQCKVSWNGRELHVRVRRGLKAPLARIAGRVRILARRQLKVQPARSARKNRSKPGESPHTIFNRNKGGHRMRMILYAERRPLEWVVGTRILGTQSKPTPSPVRPGAAATCGSGWGFRPLLKIRLSSRFAPGSSLARYDRERMGLPPVAKNPRAQSLCS